VDWDVALEAAAALLRGKRVHVIASPMLSNEALFLLSRLVARTGGSGAFHVATGPEAPLAGVDDLALRADRAANVRGAELLGFARTSAPLAGLRSGDVLVVADDTLDGVDASAIAPAAGVLVIGTVLPAAARQRADVVLPTANFAEEEGTFTNLRGRVQRFLQAKAPPGLARPTWFVLSDLLSASGESASYFLTSEVFAALAASRPEFAGMTYDSLGLKGAMLAAAARAAGDEALAGTGAEAEAGAAP
jgi:NADH-quinone oxidoreductase subunit G